MRYYRFITETPIQGYGKAISVSLTITVYEGPEALLERLKDVTGFLRLEEFREGSWCLVT